MGKIGRIVEVKVVRFANYNMNLGTIPTDLIVKTKTRTHIGSNWASLAKNLQQNNALKDIN